MANESTRVIPGAPQPVPGLGPGHTTGTAFPARYVRETADDVRADYQRQVADSVRVALDDAKRLAQDGPRA